MYLAESHQKFNSINLSRLSKFTCPLLKSSSSFHAIPRLQNETSRPILPKLLDFLLIQHAEDFAREILTVDFSGIDAERHVAQFVAGEIIVTGVVGI